MAHFDCVQRLFSAHNCVDMEQWIDNINFSRKLFDRCVYKALGFYIEHFWGGTNRFVFARVFEVCGLWCARIFDL